MLNDRRLSIGRLSARADERHGLRWLLPREGCAPDGDLATQAILFASGEAKALLKYPIAVSAKPAAGQTAIERANSTDG
jgi:hypothetical protein